MVLRARERCIIETYSYIKPRERELLKSEYPRDKLTTKTDLAKVYMVMNQKPWLACQGAQKYALQNFQLKYLEYKESNEVIADAFRNLGRHNCLPRL